MKTHTPNLHHPPHFNFYIIPKIEGEIMGGYYVDDLFWVVDILIICSCSYMTSYVAILVMPLIWIYRHNNHIYIPTRIYQKIGK